MTLLRTLLTLRDAERRPPRALKEAEDALKQWMHERIEKRVPMPRGNQTFSVAEERRADVAQTVLLKVLATLPLRSSVLERAIGAGRKNVRRGGNTESFLALGLLDPARVLDAPPREDPAFEAALGEAEEALGLYLGRMLGSCAVDQSRKDKRELLGKSKDVAGSAPDGDEKAPLDLAALEVAFSDLRRGFEEAHARMKDLAEWRARLERMICVGQKEFTIAALLAREIDARDPDSAKEVRELGAAARDAIASAVAAVPAGLSLANILLWALDERDPDTLESMSGQLDQHAADHGPAWDRVRATCAAVLDHDHAAAAGPSGKTARQVVDQRNTRLRERTTAGVDTLVEKKALSLERGQRAKNLIQEILRAVRKSQPGVVLRVSGAPAQEMS